MKTHTLHSNPAGRFSMRMRRLLSAGSTLLVSAGLPMALSAEESAPTNSVTFAVGGVAVSGDGAAMQSRNRTDGDFYGGIESLEFSQQISEDTLLKITGHALPGAEDYGLELMAEKDGLGFVRAGFKQFRTWYDATGGSLLGANMVASNVYGILDDERSIDRGEIFFEAGLRKEDVPEVTFSYRHLYREGQKDSTCWGDTLGQPWAGNASVAFKMMPALWDIDESIDIFEIDAEHTIGNTDLGAGLTYERTDISNSRYTPRNGTTPLGAGVNEVTLTENLESDMFAGHVFGVTRFNDKAWLSYAAAYSSLNSDIDGGAREYGVYWPVPVPAPTKRDYAYDTMSGGTNANQFVTNLNFMWVPVADLTVTPSLRYENESADTVSNFRAFNTNTSWLGNQELGSYADLDAITAALDVRYTGIDNIVIFGKGTVGNEKEDVLRVDRLRPGEFLATDIEVDESEVLLGCNWYARQNLSFSLQGFRSTRDQSFDHDVGDQAGGANNFRPIMTDHNSELDDINVRMTWRPISSLALVTRYDYQHGEYTNTGINWSPPAGPIIYPTVESGDIVTHIVSQSATWNALDSLYVQGSLSLARSETTTPEVYTGNSESDFFVANLTAGYALDDRTELTASYSYYVAENYGTSSSFTGVDTMGYGLNTEEHMISLGVARALTDNMVLNVRYAFITSNTTSPDQSGGVNDFDAHMLSTGLQIKF
ncbi:MAG TPA: hypothetical protein VFY13_00490 [Luteolibacter sp.]|nr:hypothetical protein [Luteolibacter sp.]